MWCYLEWYILIPDLPFLNMALEKCGENSWTDRVKNEVLQSQGGKENPTYNRNKGRLTGLVTSYTETAS